MEPPYCLVLALFPLLTISGERYGEAKFGCSLAPEICTPPEGCNSLTGNCQVPYRETDWKTYEDDLSSLVRLFEDMRSRGYGVGLDDVLRFVPDYGRRRERFSNSNSEDLFSEPADIRTILAALGDADVLQEGKTKELRRSISRLTGTEADHAPSPAKMDANNERMRLMKSLVTDAQLALADKGKKFSDLTVQERKALARFLAKLLVEDEAKIKAEKRLHQNSKPLDKGTAIVNNAKMKSAQTKSVQQDPKPLVEAAGTVNKTEVKYAPPESVVETQERPVELEQVVVQPREFDNVGSPSKSPETSSKTTDPKSKISSTKMDTLYIAIIVVGATVLLIVLVTIVSCVVYTYRIKNNQKAKFVSSTDMDHSEPFGSDYQELCRQHYASKNSDIGDDHREIIDSGSTVQDPLITRTYPLTRPTGNSGESKHQDTVSLSSHANATRNSSISSVSWSEEPVTANLDITTGHAVLSYMEDHLNNKDRLDKEWDEICGYEADNVTTAAAVQVQNTHKNRSMLALPYDHNRIKLNAEKNHLHSDYINASAIIDNDPKRPLYIAAQGPLPSTIPDFWQMMWEQGCVAIVMLTPLVEEGVNQCARYWPDEGSCTYHSFEIHLVSEHIWCEDYLVRSLYLKHLETGETRTVTQFHFLSWPKDRVPSTPKPLLELRRKVTKCYKGHNSPVLVHCSNGVSRTGTYILLDLAIDRMLKGAKEIDIAATLEHIRDQRVGMVANKDQFEFALTAVAEEVNAILKTLLH